MLLFSTWQAMGLGRRLLWPPVHCRGRGPTTASHPQAQSGHPSAAGEDMAPVNSDRPDRQGRQHPPATDQPGPHRTARPRHRCDPAPQHRQTTAYAPHSTPNAASAPLCHASPTEHPVQGAAGRSRAGPRLGARGRGGGDKGSSRPSRGSGAARRAHSARWGDSLGDRHPAPSRRRALRNRAWMGWERSERRPRCRA